MTDIDQAVLETLYSVIGGALCKEQGHEWMDVDRESAVPNVPTMQRCTRCDERRIKPINSTANDAITLADTDTTSGGIR